MTIESFIGIVSGVITIALAVPVVYNYFNCMFTTSSIMELVHYHMCKICAYLHFTFKDANCDLDVALRQLCEYPCVTSLRSQFVTANGAIGA